MAIITFDKFLVKFEKLLQDVTIEVVRGEQVKNQKELIRILRQHVNLVNPPLPPEPISHHYFILTKTMHNTVKGKTTPTWQAKLGRQNYDLDSRRKNDKGNKAIFEVKYTQSEIAEYEQWRIDNPTQANRVIDTISITKQGEESGLEAFKRYLSETVEWNPPAP